MSEEEHTEGPQQAAAAPDGLPPDSPGQGSHESAGNSEAAQESSTQPAKRTGLAGLWDRLLGK